MTKVTKTTKTTKATKTKKQSKAQLIERQHWLIVALLVAILFAFACLVYSADVFWAIDGPF